MIPIALLVWLTIALAVSASGILARAPGPGLQVLIAVLATLATAAALGIPRIRASLRDAGPFWPVALHLSRFVGIYFLWLQAQGRLPPPWATPAGMASPAGRRP